jgi:hypothetical protein
MDQGNRGIESSFSNWNYVSGQSQKRIKHR